MIDNNQIPETPKSLINRALLFVPGIYLVLLLSAIITVISGIAIVAFIYYASNQVGWMPTGIMLAIILGVLVGIFSVIKAIISTIWKRTSFTPAILISESDEKGAFAFIAEICKSMGTKAPDQIIIHAEPVFYVSQGKIETLNGKGKGRILAIGAPLMEFLSINELRAILAHEFAHFTGNDTKYSAFVLPVYIGAITAVQEMESVIASRKEGINSYMAAIPLYIPCQMLVGYLNSFHKINMQISRSRETRADYMACMVCGTENFVSGLMKVASIGSAFYELSKYHILRALQEKKVFINYYRAFEDAISENRGILSEYEKKNLLEKESANDSHPALGKRINELPNMPIKYDDDKPAVSLFNKVPEYEEKLTDMYTKIVKTRNDYEVAHANYR